MHIAEDLYTRGYISYPRTETDSFPKGFDFPSIIETLTSVPPVAAYATTLKQNIVLPRDGKHSDNAHPPIYPLKSLTNFQNKDEEAIYLFIVRHFLACCSKDAIGFETKVAFDVNNEKFKLKGLVVIERNWLDIYPYTKWEGHQIPQFNEGEKLSVDLLKMTERKTVAPKLLTEPELIALMDKEGIGTDATIAEHIKTIQERGYAVKKAGFFHPLPLGLALVKGYDAMGFNFAKPMLRSRMEKTMQEISAGKTDYISAHSTFVNEYNEAYEKIRACLACLDRSFHDEEAKANAPGQPGAPPGAPPAPPKTPGNAE